MNAHAFDELFDRAYPLTAAFGTYVPTCKYSFGWGRNSVVVDSDFGRSECVFSHTEKRQIPPEASSFRNTLYIQNYTCTDGSSAQYSTNWLGNESAFSYTAEPYKNVRCD